MTTRTYTLAVTFTAPVENPLFDAQVLADVIAGALEVGPPACVVQGKPDVTVPAVYSAVVDAFPGFRIDPRSGSTSEMIDLILRAGRLHRDVVAANSTGAV